MKGLNKLALAAAIAASSVSVNAELTALDDSALGELTGQAGVSIDVNLALSIEEFRYVDTDGFTRSNPFDHTSVEGGLGSVSFSNIAVGRIDNFAAAGRAALDADTSTDAAVTISGITIDVSDNGGVRIGLGNWGTAADGIDIRTDISINDHANGGDTANVGSFYISNLTNQVDAATVAALAAKAGNVDLSAVGAALGGSPYIPVFVEIQGGGADGAQGLTINADVGLIIDEIAYVDDGNAIGVKNLIVGDITWGATGNEIVGLGGFRVAGLTVDVIDDAGTTKLAIQNINAQGDILLGDIFLSSTDATTGLATATGDANSLGTVLIRDLDTTGTSVFIYAHD